MMIDSYVYSATFQLSQTKADARLDVKSPKLHSNGINIMGVGGG